MSLIPEASLRIEAAIAAIVPSAALNVFTGSTPLDRDDVRELLRLREFSAEFRQLIDLYDRTPPRWKYFQTEWLWMFARGMVEGAGAAEVKTRRLTELKTKGENSGEEAAALCETSDRRLLHFMKGELYGGPADGGYVHLRVPVSNEIVVNVPTADGEMGRVRYRRAPGTLGDIVQIERVKLDDIEEAFAGKKAAKYIYDALGEL